MPANSTPPWKSHRHRSRSHIRGHPGYNPFNPLVAGDGPHPTQAPPDFLNMEIERLRQQAQWEGDKARPWEQEWIEECHKHGLAIKKRLCHDRDDSTMLWLQMPRNATKTYEMFTNMSEKAKYLEQLFAFSAGEIREVYGYLE